MALMSLLFGMLLSCDNTTSDPLIDQNKSANSGSNGTTITGPRILNKVTINNSVVEEYITNAGKLSKAITNDYGSANSFTSTITYTNNRISNIKMLDNITPHVMDYNYNLLYDSSGRVSTMTCLQASVSNAATLIDYTFAYNSNGLVQKITEKKKMGGSNSYTHYTEYVLTYTGNNITKADQTVMLMDNGVPDPSTSFVISYLYENYDSKINPYTTLPKDYFTVIGALFPVDFYMLSSNNVGKITIQNPLGPPGVSPKTYLYDSQDYPVSDQSQTTKYVYKPL